MICFQVLNIYLASIYKFDVFGIYGIIRRWTKKIGIISKDQRKLNQTEAVNRWIDHSWPRQFQGVNRKREEPLWESMQFVIVLFYLLYYCTYDIINILPFFYLQYLLTSMHHFGSIIAVFSISESIHRRVLGCV